MKPETVEAVALAMCKGVANFDYLSEAQADSWINAAEEILAALTTTPEYQAMVKDSERYRWLRDGDDTEHCERWMQWELRTWDKRMGLWTGDLRFDGLDNAIDSARNNDNG